MTEYWKSNAKKYCEICKVWFADNKISVENHERGLKHIGMVQQRLRESSQRSKDRERKDNDLRHTLLCMEQAALASMKKDSNAEKEKQRTYLPTSSVALPTVNDAREENRAQRRKLAELKKTSKRSQFWDGDSETTSHSAADNEDGEGVEDVFSQAMGDVQWVQSVTETGHAYFWNIYSGDTRWDKPSEPFYTADEYNRRYAEVVSNSTLYATSTSSTSKPQDIYSSYHTPQQPVEVLEDVIKKPRRESRFDKVKDESGLEEVVRNDSAPLHQRSSKPANYIKEIKVDIKSAIPPVGLTEIKHAPVAAELLPDTSSSNKSSGNALLGPWVPVEKQKETRKTDELPEQSEDLRNPSEIIEEMSVDPSELMFAEKTLPAGAANGSIGGKKKGSKIQFKKRSFGNKNNIRSRNEEE